MSVVSLMLNGSRRGSRAGYFPRWVARLELLRLALLLLLFRCFGVNGLFVPLGRGLQLGLVVLRSLLPYKLDELAARVNGSEVTCAL